MFTRKDWIDVRDELPDVDETILAYRTGHNEEFEWYVFTASYSHLDVFIDDQGGIVDVEYWLKLEGNPPY